MSSKSGSKSKRSFKSISSNPASSSNDGSDSNKKKKTAQKTLGMAWGANYRSSSRSASRNSPFTDFGRCLSFILIKIFNLLIADSIIDLALCFLCNAVGE